MFKALIEASVRFRWFVVLATAIVAAFGLYNLTQLPIDAVPDITNRQVQINTIAPALAPEQMERQVTYPLETAMAGIPGIQTTRSLSRNGFSQVTVIFSDNTDIYFARQQVAERMAQARERVVAGLKTTFASGYSAKVPLLNMLDRAVVAEYAQMRTGEKVLIVPNG